MDTVSELAVKAVKEKMRAVAEKLSAELRGEYVTIELRVSTEGELRDFCVQIGRTGSEDWGLGVAQSLPEASEIAKQRMAELRAERAAAFTAEANRLGLVVMPAVQTAKA